jgi:transposase
MRPLQPLPKGAKRELTRLLQQAATKADYRRVLCVWLRATVGLSAAEVALALGWCTSSVYNLQSRYRREGAQALQGAGRGGPHRAWLSPEQEQRFLHSFVSTAHQGGIAEVSMIRRVYEQEVGHAVAPSTVYRKCYAWAGRPQKVMKVGFCHDGWPNCSRDFRGCQNWRHTLSKPHRLSLLLVRKCRFYREFCPGAIVHFNTFST